MKAEITATKEQLKSIGIPLDDNLKQGDIVEVRIIPKAEAPIHPTYGEFYEIDEGFGNYFYSIPFEFFKFL